MTTWNDWPAVNTLNEYLRIRPALSKLAFAMIWFVPIFPCKAESPTIDPNRFHSPAAGFTIMKPEHWHFVSNEEVAEYRSTIRLDDKELETQIRERASAPLVAITKYEEARDDVNPAVQVIVRPLGKLRGKSALDLMRLVVPSLQRGFKDFTFLDEPQEVKVSEMPAAYMKAKFKVTNPEGTEFRSVSRTWIVPRGQLMFSIGMSGPQEGEDVSEEEFTEILESIKIDK